MPWISDDDNERYATSSDMAKFEILFMFNLIRTHTGTSLEYWHNRISLCPAAHSLCYVWHMPIAMLQYGTKSAAGIASAAIENVQHYAYPVKTTGLSVNMESESFTIHRMDIIVKEA